MFFGLSHPENILFNFENKITADGLRSDIPRLAKYWQIHELNSDFIESLEAVDSVL